MAFVTTLRLHQTRNRNRFFKYEWHYLPSGGTQTRNFRSERRRRQRKMAAISRGQTTITDCFVILDQLEKLEKTNAKLREVIQEITNKYKLQQSEPESDSSNMTILKKMMRQAMASSTKNEKGH